MTLGPRATLLATVGLLVAAALLRFVGIGLAPLDAAEASQSIAAWWTASGVEERLSRLEPEPASALLLGLDALVFWLAGGAGDGLARLVPAAAGAALVLLPIALSAASREGALVLAVLLAVDPWLVAHSRHAGGAILAAGAAVACHLLWRRLAAAAPGSAAAAASRRGWAAWAVAAGLLAVSGPAAWDFLPAVLASAALLVVGGRAGAVVGERPRPTTLLALAAAAALVAATTGLLQWNGPPLVSVSLESWLRSFTAPAAAVAAASPARPLGALAVGYLLALAALAVPALARGWRRGTDHGSGRSPARRVEVEALALWLVWGAALQLRPGGDSQTRLALVVPLLLSAALALEDLLPRAFRARSAAARRLAAAAAAVLLAALGLEGVRLAARDGRRVALPPVVRLAADVAALEERPLLERPRIEVVARDRIDPLLAWYLRGSRVRWVRGGGTGTDEPRVVLVARAVPRAEAAAVTSSAWRYAIADSGETVDVVELR